MTLGLFLIGVLVLALAGACAAVYVIRRKNLHYWLRSYYLPQLPREVPDADEPLHVFISVCDHWEPEWNQPSREISIAKVDRWVREYPKLYAEFRDSDGRPPQHTFFVPQDEYRPEYLDRIATLCHAGFGDVDVHLHHDHDTAEALEEKLEAFRQTLFHRHGLLRRHPVTGEIVYGFIHGNWALCNSRPDGRQCGVDQELTVLLKTGCYADFTMPSAPNNSQTRLINSIYYAKDIPGRRKSHDFGTPACVGQTSPADHLLMVQGPLTLDWSNRRKGILPSIENGDVIAGRPLSMRRWRQWTNASVHVQGQPNWLFVKLHTHGCKDGNIDAWLGPDMQGFHRDLRAFARANPNLRYHYVTAWETAQLVHQAEAGAKVPEIGPAVNMSARRV